MPTPYPDPFSGLAKGLQSGFQMGLAARQQKQAEEETRFNKAIKYLQLGVEYGKVKNPVYKNAGLEFYKKAIKEGGDLIGLDASTMPQDLSWNEGFDEINNEISAALKAYQDNGDRVTLGKAVTSAYQKAGQVLEDTQLKSLQETTESTIKSIEEANKPPGGMDALLAGRVEKGELTIEEAYNIKKRGEEEKTDHYTIVNPVTREKKSVRLQAGESIPSGWEIYHEPKVSETPEGKTEKELNIAKKMEGFVKDSIIRQFGKEAVQYDPFSETWAVTPAYENNRKAIDNFAREERVKQYKRFNMKYPTEDIDETTAREILMEVGGDKEKARALAKKRGFSFK